MPIGLRLGIMASVVDGLRICEGLAGMPIEVAAQNNAACFYLAIIESR